MLLKVSPAKKVKCVILSLHFQLLNKLSTEQQNPTKKLRWARPQKSTSRRNGKIAWIFQGYFAYFLLFPEWTTWHISTKSFLTLLLMYLHIVHKVFWKSILKVSFYNNSLWRSQRGLRRFTRFACNFWMSDFIPLISNHHQVYVLLLRLLPATRFGSFPTA